MDIWRINLRNKTLKREPVPESWGNLGGRGLIARIMVDEVPPTCNPLGPKNKLIFAPGLLVGHMLSSCDRISVGGKSPLTGGIKESNAGGRTGLQLTYLNIKALLLEDRPDDNDWSILHLSVAGAKFEPAGDLIGKGVYESAKILIERYGPKVAIALIGPGGELGMAAAGIQNLDKDRVPSRINARGGLGAVLGSKRIKAIVIDSSGGTKAPIADLEAFRKAQKIFNQALSQHPVVESYTLYGTAALSMLSNTLGGLPTRNFSEGEFSGISTISGEYMRDLLLRRGGESQTTHACMAGCTIRCSNVFGGEDGKSIVSPLEYETIGLMGSNLGIDSLDTIARLNYEANDLGLDTIEIGSTLGVACDAGLMQFGDGERAMELLNEIRLGTPLGRILGNGAGMTGRIFGVERVPVVKNQAISAYDPRAIKGTGVTYATSPQGADHTCGLTIRFKVDHRDPAGQVDLSRTMQINNAGYDTLGACIFSSFGFATASDSVRDLLNARYGTNVGSGILQELGKQTLVLERKFNRLAGFTSADDRLPEWMTSEQLSPTGAVFDVDNEEMDQIFQSFETDS